MNIRTIIASVAFMAIPMGLCAQSIKSEQQLSNDLKNEIAILKADIKALKARQKADPTNAELTADINTKNIALKEATNKKKIVDENIKANKKHEKETKQAEKAIKQNDKAQAAADNLRANGQHNGKSNELLSDELEAKIDILNADIKALNARKKADPKNAEILAQLAQKKVELKEAKRQKKIFDGAISAEKKAKKEVKHAEKAKDRLDKATEKRNNI